jgi:acetyltransferase
VRGQQPVKIPAIEDMIVNLSNLIKNNPEIKELDLNPVIATPDNVIAVDARILLD